jgi:hypothetical protein
MFVIIQGLVSKESLKRIDPTFENDGLLTNETFLFIDYSQFELPIGYEFQFLIKKPSEIYPLNAKIKMVTQEWGKQFKNGIPSGHRTIVKFSLDTQSFKLINSIIPAVDFWQNFDHDFFLSNTDILGASEGRSFEK